jgi:hypothetical protein
LLSANAGTTGEKTNPTVKNIVIKNNPAVDIHLEPFVALILLSFLFTALSVGPLIPERNLPVISCIWKILFPRIDEPRLLQDYAFHLGDPSVSDPLDDPTSLQVSRGVKMNPPKEPNIRNI